MNEAFHLLIKPTGATCNLRCRYCFYLEKAELFPDGVGRMDERLEEESISQYLESQKVPEVTLTWQGGEPTLMGLGFFQRAVKLAERHRRPGQTVKFALQTNGVLLDDHWCAFLKEHGFLVGVSLDGPRELHDRFRVDQGDNPTFDRVLGAVRLLQKHGVELNILCAVHAENAGQPRAVYRFLRDDVGAEFIQPIPIVERESGGSELVSERSVGSRQWGDFLIGVFDEWVRRDVGRVFVQTFDATLGAWMGGPTGVCLFEETCGRALVLEHNGDLYACDHFVQDEHRLGNISKSSMGTLARSEAQRRFGTAKRDELPEACRRCSYLFACRGECPKNRFVPTGDGGHAANYLCPGYLAYFEHTEPSMRKMAELLRRRQPPALIMQGSSSGSVPSEAPCPCGNGLPFAQCHGAQ
jgi:uncharacterized protein